MLMSRFKRTSLKNNKSSSLKSEFHQVTQISPNYQYLVLGIFKILSEFQYFISQLHMVSQQFIELVFIKF